MKFSTRLAIVIAAVLGSQSIGFAADYPPMPQQPQYAPPPPAAYPPPQPIYAPPPPPPVYVPPPPAYTPPPPMPILALRGAVGEYSGWYLRGDIGVSAQRYKNFDFTQTNPGFTWPASWRIDQHDLKDSTFFALGIGYQFGGWFRVDVTGEYRSSTKGKAVGSYSEFCPGGDRCFDIYDWDHQASVFLANAYIDLGTWWCFTPFFGVGLGAAYHTFDAMSDLGTAGNQSPGFGYSSASSSDWTFAWAIHAGVAYEVTKSLKIELAYRYLDLGSPNTGIINCAASGCGGTGGPQAYYTLTDLHANELKLGVRWLIDCCEVPPPPPPPLMRRG